MISNEDKLCTKIVERDEIYNFIFDNSFIYSHLIVQKIIIFALVSKSTCFELFSNNLDVE